MILEDDWTGIEQKHDDLFLPNFTFTRAFCKAVLPELEYALKVLHYQHAEERKANEGLPIPQDRFSKEIESVSRLIKICRDGQTRDFFNWIHTDVQVVDFRYLKLAIGLSIYRNEMRIKDIEEKLNKNQTDRDNINLITREVEQLKKLLTDPLFKSYSPPQIYEYVVIDIACKTRQTQVSLSLQNQQLFAKNDSYKYHTIIRDIIKRTNNNLMIVDNYANYEIFDLLLYVDKLESIDKVLIVGKLPDLKEERTLILSAKKFSNDYRNLYIEIRKSKESHDRFIMVDEREVWKSGASLKDGGKALTGIDKVSEENFPTTKHELLTIWGKAIQLFVYSPNE